MLTKLITSSEPQRERITPESFRGSRAIGGFDNPAPNCADSKMIQAPGNRPEDCSVFARLLRHSERVWRWKGCCFR